MESEMSEFNREAYAGEAGGLKAYITKVMTKMGIAMVITAAVAFAVYASGLYVVLASSLMFLIVAIVQLVLCGSLSASLSRMDAQGMTAKFYGYAALTGVTFSILPLVFDVSTIFYAFAYAAVMFFACAVIGHTTNVDLSKFSGLFMGAMIAMLVALVFAMFIPGMNLAISYIGIILFLGITAWDMQKIKSYYYGTNEGYGVAGESLAVYGAFSLYLDFINVFLYVLRILGVRSDRN